jgi:hypothetical protein
VRIAVDTRSIDKRRCAVHVEQPETAKLVSMMARYVLFNAGEVLLKLVEKAFVEPAWRNQRVMAAEVGTTVVHIASHMGCGEEAAKLQYNLDELETLYQRALREQR